MNRTQYYDYIDEKLQVLSHRIETGGKLNMLSLHMHSENFYLHLFNMLFDYELENLNSYLQNVEAIDLIDHKNKIIIQVTATNTKRKVESSLEKGLLKEYPGYSFKFISIAKDASNLRKNTFSNPHAVHFEPVKDIYDVKSILNSILVKDIDKLKEIYELIKKELGGEVDIVKLDTNLANIINILAQENWEKVGDSDPVNTFQIERKIAHNELDSARSLIEEYCLYHGKVDAKYSVFDSLGNNKSSSVLAAIKREYIKIKNNKSSDEVFFAVIEEIKNKILSSANFAQIPLDELELCVDILVVDAFIRCKIMENPKGYNYAAS